MSFRKKVICNECDTEFDSEPDECPMCKEISIIEEMIENMETKEDYLKIKLRIAPMEDSIPKFDLYNKTNVKRTKLNL
jgi:predicted ATP-dependent serine protease